MKKSITSIKYFLLVLYVFLVSNNIYSQTYNQYVVAGNESFNKGEYYAAISYFKKATEFHKKSDEIYFKIGQSYLELKDYSKSLKAFSKVKTKSAFPYLFYKMANSFMLIGDYDQAIKYYESFKNSYRKEDFYSKNAVQKIASCYWAKDHISSSAFPENRNIKIASVDRNINTQFSEFAASYFKDSILQVTSFFQDEKDRKSDYISDILFYQKKQKKYDKIEIEIPIKKNKQLANGFYLEEKKRFYYNQCEMTNGNSKRCDLYVTEFINNSWSEAVALNINDKKYTSTQASVYVNKEGKDVIFFVSDRVGGYGKNDIWTAVESSLGNFEKLENLPENINTKDDEASPFFDKINNEIYFSSKWHYGFGAYDIFKAKKENNTYNKAINLGRPYNSSANDLYFKTDTNENGFLSSNREGAMVLRGAACCYDIFNFEKVIRKDTVSKIDSLLLVHTQTPSKNTDKNILKNEFQSIDSVDLLLTKIREMLPVVVYFHNDEPNPKTTGTATYISYNEAYNSFLTMKDEYYKMNEFNEIDAFFYDNLEKGFIDLKAFNKLLNLLVTEKLKIKLEIKAYCSPLAANDYNINLAKRRIASLKNELSKNTNIKLAMDNRNIQIVELPFGEEKSKKNVSDDYYNVKESIYNPKAALERRVSIVGILIEK